MVPTPHVQDSQVVRPTSVDWQREQGRLDALRTAAALRGTGRPAETSIAPSQVAVTTTPAVVGGLVLEESEVPETSRQIPVGSIVPSTERYIWPRHPDVQYINVFPFEMSLNQPDIDLRLNPDEGWKLLYPFTEPEV